MTTSRPTGRVAVGLALLGSATAAGAVALTLRGRQEGRPSDSWEAPEAHPGREEQALRENKRVG